MPAEEKRFAPARVPKSRRLVRLFVTGMLCLHLLFFFKLLPRIQRGYPDFTVLYTAATILHDGLGHQLYDQHIQYEVQKNFAGQTSRHGALPYIHPPFEALIFLPLTYLPYRQAFAVWDLLNLAALFGVALLLRRSVSALRLIPPWEFVVASLAFFPVFACFLQGQDSILILLLCALGFNALKREADVLAGCWFALGAFKFQLMVPFVLLIVIWKRGRVAAGFAAVLALLALVSVRLVGWEGLRYYPVFALHVASEPNFGGVPAKLLPNLHGLIQGWPSPFSSAVGTVLAVLSSVLLFLFAAMKGWKASQPGKIELQFSLAVTVSGLIGWQTNAHDLSLLVLPLVLITDYCLRMPSRAALSRFELLLPALPILISPLWIVLWLYAGQVNLIAIPLLWWTWKIGEELSRGGPHSAGGP